MNTSPSAEQRTLHAASSGTNDCGPDTAPSVGFNPLKATVVAGVLVTLGGWSDPGEKWFWNRNDNECDYLNKVTYNGVTVTLDDGQQIKATNLDTQWTTWSAAVTFKQAGVHTATVRSGP
jgi:hypothetical protein